MLDGTEGLTAPVTQIDKHILRHMLAETRDLLDEASGYAVESARYVQAAMAVTRADWLLMAVHTWLSEQLSPDTIGHSISLDNPIDVAGIEYETLSAGLQYFIARVDRLYARTRNLETLVRMSLQVPEEPRPRPEGQVLHIFGESASMQAAENAVRETHRRLNRAFRTA